MQEPELTVNTLAPPSLAAEMIFGVWISQNPLLVKVSRNSLHTPPCSLKIACLVVVCKVKSKSNFIKCYHQIHFNMYNIE